MVADGMTLGLGTGSTAGWFVRLLSERIRETGLAVTGSRPRAPPCGWRRSSGCRCGGWRRWRAST
jgi:hypothetical protein